MTPDGQPSLLTRPQSENALQSLEAVERQGHLREDDGGTGCRARREEDRDDRREQANAMRSSEPAQVPEGSPHGVQSGRQKGGRGRLIGRTKGGMNTKLHAICDSQGRPLNLFVTAGQVSDYIGARVLCDSLPNADWLLGHRSRRHRHLLAMSPEPRFLDALRPYFEPKKRT